MNYRTIIGIVAIIISLASYIPYLRNIFRNHTKPHAFSWLVWSILNAIGFASQLSDGAGADAWVTGVASVLFQLFASLIINQMKKLCFIMQLS